MGLQCSQLLERWVVQRGGGGEGRRHGNMDVLGEKIGISLQFIFNTWFEYLDKTECAVKS